jgi:hypothetical protein
MFELGALERCSTKADFNLTYKHCTRLQLLASEKHFSLFGQLMSFEENVIVNTATVMAVTFFILLTPDATIILAHILLSFRNSPTARTFFSSLSLSPISFTCSSSTPFTYLPVANVIKLFLPLFTNDPRK